MLKSFLLTLALASTLAAQNARNVVLFLGDAGGVATLNAASVLGHDAPLKLYIQNMPHIGLSDTSTASQWVSDSAAGMTAVVTGRKTHNGVVSQGPDAVRGEQDGAPLKTILEHAEERGLATGVVTNMTATDATPAATYAHANDRRDFARIFRQLFEPRFGDGVDVLIGPGRGRIDEALAVDGSTSVAALMEQAGRPLYESLDAIPGDAQRAIALFESRDEFSLPRAVEIAVDILSQNPKGFFLMVEGDMHTSRVEPGLRRMLELDDIVRATAERLPDDTLLLFTADHSFDLRIVGGKRGEPLLREDDPGYPEEGGAYRGVAVRMDGDHTGEEVVVAAQGPGAERVRGYMPNTRIFHIMMQAYGWQ